MVLRAVPPPKERKFRVRSLSGRGAGVVRSRN